MTTLTLNTVNGSETIQVKSGFTFGIFGNMDSCDDFIWSYLFDNGKQYLKPVIALDGVYLVYQD